MQPEIILVLLAGVFKQSHVYFEDFCKYFEVYKNFSFYPIDLPKKKLFCEDPDPELGHVSLMDYVDITCDRITKISSEKPNAKIILVGHSLGGMICQLTAEKLGNKVHGMVLLCPCPSKEIRAFSFSGLLTFGELFFRYGFFWGKPVNRSFLATSFGLYNKMMSNDQKKKTYDKSAWESGQVLLEVTLQRPSVDQSKVMIPVFVVGGSEDRLIDKKVIRSMAKKYKGQFTVIPNASHDIFWGVSGRKAMEKIRDWISLNF